MREGERPKKQGKFPSFVDTFLGFLSSLKFYGQNDKRTIGSGPADMALSGAKSSKMQAEDLDPIAWTTFKTVFHKKVIPDHLWIQKLTEFK